MNIFTPIKINGMVVKNRFVRSATQESLATPEGFASERLTNVLVELAKNELGMIITGHAFVSPEGRAGNLQQSAASSDAVNSFRETVDQIHKYGGKVILQLAHAGGYAKDADNAVGPSPFIAREGRKPCREMTKSEIAHVVSCFADAARRAEECGFDGVQLHAAHGYLLSEFLSPYYNKRQDEYNGDADNRARFLFETLEAVRAAVSPDFPVMVKINAENFIDDGCFAALPGILAGMEKRGLDAVELSGALPVSPPQFMTIRPGDIKPNAPAYYEEQAKILKTQLHIPVIVVGGIRYREQAERMISENVCDMVSLCRPLIREPELIARWQEDPTRAACISCNRCLRPLITGKDYSCPIKNQLH